jgi:hypothetical protein
MCALRDIRIAIVLSLAIGAALAPVNAADKADRRKSQLAYQRGVRADAAGKRDEAIAAYSEAIQADESFAAAWRARGKDREIARRPVRTWKKR